MNCPCCGKKITAKAMNTKYNGVFGVYQCPKCEAVLGQCYKGDSYNVVLPYFVKEEPPQDRVRYYDLTVLGSEGIERRHGWFDTQTRRVVQAG